eukprot:TRINITY_DN19302_c0_g1_i1.p1 TRINITY_DN19302_c0_g1~~TRINITY_DN19302_c0_g1_i1.p1  ORF type:complete len:285 (-),score=51.09 TRINITY_DN19302_c0_g1_i1:267-1121(-)
MTQRELILTRRDVLNRVGTFREYGSKDKQVKCEADEMGGFHVECKLVTSMVDEMGGFHVEDKPVKSKVDVMGGYHAEGKLVKCKADEREGCYQSNDVDGIADVEAVQTATRSTFTFASSSSFRSNSPIHTLSAGSSSSFGPKPPRTPRPRGGPQRPGSHRHLRPASAMTFKEVVGCLNSSSENGESTHGLSPLPDAGQHSTSELQSPTASLQGGGFENVLKKHMRLKEQRKRRLGPALNFARRQAKPRAVTLYEFPEFEDVASSSEESSSGEAERGLSDTDAEA